MVKISASFWKLCFKTKNAWCIILFILSYEQYLPHHHPYYTLYSSAEINKCYSSKFQLSNLISHLLHTKVNVKHFHNNTQRVVSHITKVYIKVHSTKAHTADGLMCVVVHETISAVCLFRFLSTNKPSRNRAGGKRYTKKRIFFYYFLT